MDKEAWHIFKNKDFKSKEEYKGSFGRRIKDTEICIEFDEPCPDFLIATYDTIANLTQANYRVERWRAWGMKCAHLHIKDIERLDKLPERVRRKYREKFAEKYVDPEFYQYVDKGLFKGHTIAEENKKHFKYGTPKILECVHNDYGVNTLERHLVRRAEIELQKEVFAKRHFHEDRNKLGESILAVAEEYGLAVNKYNKVLCPFHDDTDPSLSLDDERGIWYCFGCQRSGNIAKLRRLLKEARK